MKRHGLDSRPGRYSSVLSLVLFTSLAAFSRPRLLQFCRIRITVRMFGRLVLYDPVRVRPLCLSRTPHLRQQRDGHPNKPYEPGNHAVRDEQAARRFGQMQSQPAIYDAQGHEYPAVP